MLVRHGLATIICVVSVHVEQDGGDGGQEVIRKTEELDYKVRGLMVLLGGVGAIREDAKARWQSHGVA